MIPERILNALSLSLVILFMAVICWYLADGWMPDKIYAKHPVYTAEYVQRLEGQKIYYQKQAAWYERGWEKITKMLEQ